MDVGADNFRFTLEDRNGVNKPAQTWRKPKTTELHIKSLDRYKPSDLQTTTQFQNFPDQVLSQIAGPILLAGYNAGTRLKIQTSRPLVNGYFSRIALTEFQISLRQSTITSGVNTSLTYNVGGLDTSISIPPGDYTFISMRDTIQNLIRINPASLQPTFTMFVPGDVVVGVLNPVGYSFSCANPFYFTLAPPALGVFQTGNSSAKLGRILGLDRACYGFLTVSPPAGQTEVPVGWTLVRSTRQPNMNFTDYFDIYSSYLSNYKRGKDRNTSVANFGECIGRVWLTECPMVISGGWQSVGTGNPYVANNVAMVPITFRKKWRWPNWSEWSPNATVDMIDIELKDMFGTVVNWQPTDSTEWSATLTLSE